MINITEWLRREAELVELPRLSEAADELDRLRAEVARLRAELAQTTRIVSTKDGYFIAGPLFSASGTLK